MARVCYKTIDLRPDRLALDSSSLARLAPPLGLRMKKPLDRDRNHVPGLTQTNLRNAPNLAPEPGSAPPTAA